MEASPVAEKTSRFSSPDTGFMLSKDDSGPLAAHPGLAWCKGGTQLWILPVTPWGPAPTLSLFPYLLSETRPLLTTVSPSPLVLRAA